MLNINGTTLCGMKDTLIIPDGISTIEQDAFRECQWIKHVQFPTSLSFIHNCAFYHCTSLEDVILQKVLAIGKYAFCGCTSLKRVIIPEGVTKIGDYAFAGCHALEEIHIPSSVAEISSSAFTDCVSLKKITVAADNKHYSSDGIALLNKKQTLLEILPAGCDAYTIPETVTHIGYNACSGCVKIKNIVIPNNVVSIDSKAFSRCVSLESVILSNELKAIECGVFEKCISLVDVRIPDSIIEIRNDAFAGCESLSRIEIPDSVHTIEQRVFSGCSMLCEIKLPNHPKFDTINSSMFSKCISLQEIDLLNVTTIDKTAFYGCRNLRKIVMNHINYVGNSFQKCTSLTAAGIIAPAGYATKIINSINVNRSKMNDLAFTWEDTQNKKIELIKGVWEDYLKQNVLS